MSVTYEDVTLAGMLGTQWDGLVAWCAQGVQRQAADRADASAVKREAEAFRRAHHLEAGEDLRAWLSERDLTVATWESHLQRRVLLGGVSWPPRPSSLPTGFEDAIRTDSFCTGFWHDGARRLVDWMVAPGLLGHDVGVKINVRDLAKAALLDEAAGLSDLDAAWCDERLSTLASWMQAYEQLGTAIANDGAVRSLVDRNWAEWTTLEMDLCAFGTPSAANEALLCATEDGDGPEDVARRARAELRRQVVRAGDLESGIASILLSTGVGEVVGPFRIGSEWVVMWLLDRQAPDPDDPGVRAEAARTLVDAAVEGATRGELHWHGPT